MLKFLVRILLIGAIGYGAWLTAMYFMNNKPSARRRKKMTKMAARVSVEQSKQQAHSVIIEAMGTVSPAREVTLASQVSGRVISLSQEVIPGAVIAEGLELISIDPTDYEIELSRKKAVKVQSEYQLKVEMGRQSVAKREWQILDSGKDATELERELALRVPHLKNAQAVLNASEADLEKAKINLSRTHVKAPFNAMVLEKFVELGSYLGIKDKIVSIVGTDEYWVRVAVPVEKLKWLSFPTNDEVGSEVSIFNNSGHMWKGNVLRLIGQLEEKGRMAQVLVSVKDPLGNNGGQKKIPLSLGSYVRAEIKGTSLENVFRISRSSLRENDTVWYIAEDKTFASKQVKVVWRGSDYVLVSGGLDQSTRLITSNLSTPIPGMPLLVDGDPVAKKMSKGAGKGDNKKGRGKKSGKGSGKGQGKGRDTKQAESR